MKTVINIKADKEVKESAQKIAADLGFTLSALVNAYLKNFTRTKTVFFSVEEDIRGTKLEKLLGKVEQDIKKGKNISKEFHSVKEAIRYLNA